MTCHSHKRILQVVAVILIALVSFAIGVSFGTSYNKESLIDVLFPALSVVGNWVAGIGAVAAVFTSLWLSDNQKKLNSEELNVTFNVAVLYPDITRRLVVIVVSKGNRPANVQSLSILSTDSTVAMWVKDIDAQSNPLPIVMPYGHRASFILVQGTESFINKYVKENCNDQFSGLKMQVNTTLGSFTVPFNKEILEHLRNLSTNK